MLMMGLTCDKYYTDFSLFIHKSNFESIIHTIPISSTMGLTTTNNPNIAKKKNKIYNHKYVVYNNNFEWHIISCASTLEEKRVLCYRFFVRKTEHVQYRYMPYLNFYKTKTQNV